MSTDASRCPNSNKLAANLQDVCGSPDVRWPIKGHHVPYKCGWTDNCFVHSGSPCVCACLMAEVLACVCTLDGRVCVCVRMTKAASWCMAEANGGWRKPAQQWRKPCWTCVYLNKSGHLRYMIELVPLVSMSVNQSEPVHRQIVFVLGVRVENALTFQANA